MPLSLGGMLLGHEIWRKPKPVRLPGQPWLCVLARKNPRTKTKPLGGNA
jgi:hypothetical protein